MNEKGMVTLAINYFHLCNVLEDLHMTTDNPYTLAELAYIFTPYKFRWLASRRERVDWLHAVDEVNSTIREVMVMELEQLRSETVQVSDYCCRRDANPHLTLVFDCYLLPATSRRGVRDSISFLPFDGRKSASMGYRERINWTNKRCSNSQWLLGSPFNCRRPKQRASTSSRGWKRYFPSHVSGHWAT
jgi:hypothetical protein